MRTRIAAAAMVCVLGVLAGGCGGGSSNKLTIGVKYSHFTPTHVSAHAGDLITITLRNDDPIEHEWIIGTEAVHERHRTGTEPFHDSIPTEVTLPPYSTRVTKIYFDSPGALTYVCHLPGHEAYGMVGTLDIQ
jgi:uncharacterized cupredoxin-like copper-binding protein